MTIQQIERGIYLIVGRANRSRKRKIWSEISKTSSSRSTGLANTKESHELIDTFVGLVEQFRLAARPFFHSCARCIASESTDSFVRCCQWGSWVEEEEEEGWKGRDREKENAENFVDVDEGKILLVRLTTRGKEGEWEALFSSAEWFELCFLFVCNE